jgi:hypothetical protein
MSSANAAVRTSSGRSNEPINAQLLAMSNFPPDFDKLDDDPEMIECSECGGEGWICDGEERCGNCGGTGRMPNDQLSEFVQSQIRAKKNRY